MSDARRIADERFARGEIDAAQHKAIVDVISASQPSAPEKNGPSASSMDFFGTFGRGVFTICIFLATLLFFANIIEGPKCKAAAVGSYNFRACLKTIDTIWFMVLMLLVVGITAWVRDYKKRKE